MPTDGRMHDTKDKSKCKCVTSKLRKKCEELLNSVRLIYQGECTKDAVALP